MVLGPHELDAEHIQVGDTIPAGEGEMFRMLDVLEPGELRERAG